MNESTQTACVRARSLHRQLLSLLVVALGCIQAPSSNATTVLAPGFPQMVARAERIFTATVSSVQSAWEVRGGHRCIITTVAFTIEQMHKGAAAKELKLDFLGGRMGQDTMEVQGVPKFRVGERVILFSENNGRQFCPLVGIHHGKLLIEQDPRSGSSVVLRHNRQPVTQASDVGSDRSPSIVAAGRSISPGPMPVEDFLEALKKELQTGARP